MYAPLATIQSPAFGLTIVSICMRRGEEAPTTWLDEARRGCDLCVLADYSSTQARCVAWRMEVSTRAAF